MAIVNGTPLPDTVAVRALAYIRSKLLSTADADKKPLLSDTMACQWLKVWLIRKRRMRNEEENLMEYYEPNFPNAAYHCGAWLAVYANLQRAAMGDVNDTLVQRFYASASPHTGAGIWHTGPNGTSLSGYSPQGKAPVWTESMKTS